MEVLPRAEVPERRGLEGLPRGESLERQGVEVLPRREVLERQGVEGLWRVEVPELQGMEALPRGEVPELRLLSYRFRFGRRDGDDLPFLLDVVEKGTVEGVAGQRRRVPDDRQFHAGAGDGDVHPPQVGEEADLPGVVRADQADEDDVALLPLEAVDGVYRNQFPERAEKSLLADEAAQVLHLRFVGRDDAEVDALVE